MKQLMKMHFRTSLIAVSALIGMGVADIAAAVSHTEPVVLAPLERSGSRLNDNGEVIWQDATARSIFHFDGTSTFEISTDHFIDGFVRSSSRIDINNSGMFSWTSGGNNPFQIASLDSPTGTFELIHTSSSQIVSQDLTDNGKIIFRRGNDPTTFQVTLWTVDADGQNLRLIDTLDGSRFVRAFENDFFDVNSSGQVAYSDPLSGELRFFDGETTTTIPTGGQLDINGARGNGHLSLNDSGDIVFAAQAAGDFRNSIHLYSNSTLTRIGDVESISVNGIHLNNAGQAVWEDGGNIILWENGSTRTLWERPVDSDFRVRSPILNNDGQAAWAVSEVVPNTDPNCVPSDDVDCEFMLASNILFFDGARIQMFLDEPATTGADLLGLNDQGQILWVGGGNINLSSQRINVAPVSDPGTDVVVEVGETVSLNGAGTSDDDDSLAQLQVRWAFVSQPADSTAVLIGEDSLTPSFTADVAGDYVVELTVTDLDGAASTETVTVTAFTEPLAPEQILVGVTETIETLAAGNDNDARNAVKAIDQALRFLDRNNIHVVGVHIRNAIRKVERSDLSDADKQQLIAELQGVVDSL